MNRLDVDLSQAEGGILKEFVAGTLVLVPTQTESSEGPFWGLRFDASDEDGPVPCVLWLNGMPWHGAGKTYGMPIGDSSYGEVGCLGCGIPRIRIDISSGSGRRRTERRWDLSAGYVAVTSRGKFIVGEKSRQYTPFGAHYAVEIGGWTECEDAWRSSPIEWFARWSLVIDGAAADVVLPINADALVEAA